MPEHLSKHSKLLVISDTGIYESKGKVYAFGPVVRELEALTATFESIVWIGYNRPDQLHNAAYEIIDLPNISTVMLKRVGGTSILDKLSILWQYPQMFLRIQQLVKGHQKIHVRAPSHPAVIAILLAQWYSKKQFWFKYAGSWVEAAPYFYDLQRRLLKRLKHPNKVTVNGTWPLQKSHILAFENPCLTIQDRARGATICQQKTCPQAYDYCFVGGLNTNKGIEPLLAAFREIPKQQIGVIHVVGDGVLKSQIIELTKSFPHNIIIHGHLAKEQVVAIYTKSHFVVLPSKSEGFPKVISEAMNYGCIPLVSDVSCVGQYIHHKTNGYLIASQSTDHIKDALEWGLNLSTDDFQLMVVSNYEFSECFTYERYINRVHREIFVID